jgi:hypothetical protein
MKHIKLFENTITIKSMKKTINDYENFIEYIKPFVMEKYEELAEDENYFPEDGDPPTSNDDPLLISSYNLGVGIGFHLQGSNNNGEVSANYYINFKDDELEQWIKECETRNASKKYNL